MAPCNLENEMEPQEIKEIIIKELPSILKDDPEMPELIQRMTEGRYADKEQTESRFDRILDELRRDREAETGRWKQLAQERAEERTADADRWSQLAQDLARDREFQDERWKQLAQERAEERKEQARLWGEQKSQWEDQNRKWEENHQIIKEMLDSIKALAQKHESTIGALGSRWGLYSEHSFRNALKGILEDHFAVMVMNIKDFDDSGVVFGRPDQIELDIVVANGVMIICEIKSSMSKSDMHIFERKARFYERKHNRQATRLMVISPMVDKRARALADQLGIAVYSYPEDIEPSTFSDVKSRPAPPGEGVT
jgi:hypothetical protein